MSAPVLSVVLVTATRLTDLCLTLQALAQQGAREHLELVLVSPGDESLPQARWLTGFHSVSLIRVPALASRGRGAAPGVRAARGDIIALMENHVLPEPGWAEAIIRAHKDPWAAVGPRIVGLPSRSWVARANGLVNYARFSGYDRPLEVPELPWHNTTYKRQAILQFAEQLDTLLDREADLHAALRAQGQRLCLVPTARLRHMHVSNVLEALSHTVHSGRVFAAERARTWPWWRRLAYAASWPLFPFLRYAHMRADLQRIARVEPVWRFVPLVFAMMCGISIGEALGYMGGPGRSGEWAAMHELRFIERANSADRAALEDMMQAARRA